nr:MAG TPA: hypothetical protein [Caudoviricetes sp.]
MHAHPHTLLYINIRNYYIKAKAEFMQSLLVITQLIFFILPA